MKQVRVEVVIEDYNMNTSERRAISKYGGVVTKQMAIGLSVDQLADIVASNVKETLKHDLTEHWEL